MMGDFNVSDEGRTKISIYTTKYDLHTHRLHSRSEIKHELEKTYR